MTIATMNPLDAQQGTYQLPAAQLDRFTMQLSMGFPPPEAEMDMLDIHLAAQPPIADLKPVIDTPTFLGWQQLVAQIFISERIKAYLVELVNRMRSDAKCLSPPSPRATLMLARVAQAHAMTQGRDFESARHSTDSTGCAGASHRAVRKPVWSWLCRANASAGCCTVVSEATTTLPFWLWTQQLWAYLLLLSRCGMLIFSDAQFASTAGIFTALFLLMLVPTFGMLLVATVTKVRRDRAAHTNWTFPKLFASIQKHAGILTARGWGVLWAGVFFTMAAMCARWASLGTTSVFLLLLLYSVIGVSALISTFRINAFHTSSKRNTGMLRREMSPAVVVSGSPAEERFVLDHVPIPLGFLW